MFLSKRTRCVSFYAAFRLFGRCLRGLLTGEGDFVCGKDRIGLQGRFKFVIPSF